MPVEATMTVKEGDHAVGLGPPVERTLGDRKSSAVVGLEKPLARASAGKAAVTRYHMGFK
jgi:hypothetical protein